MTIANQTINYHGCLPEQYLTNDALCAGLLKLLAMAGIKAGWKTDAKLARGDIALLELACARILQATAKSKRHSVGYKRVAKA